MLDKFYILIDGKPRRAKRLEWARWFEDIDNRRVHETKVGRAVVSTVFLGIDHNFTGKGPAILFETMVFREGHDIAMRRYATLGEAKKGHWEAVEALKVKHENAE